MLQKANNPTATVGTTGLEKDTIKIPLWVSISGGLLCGVLVLCLLYLLLKRLNQKQKSEEYDWIEKFQIPIVQLPLPPTPSNASSTSSLAEESYFVQGDSNFLDPNIYLPYEEERLPGSPYVGPGRLCFSAYYDKLSEKLKIKLIRATRLTPKGRNMIATPYIKIYLLPNKRQRVQSRVVYRTSNPEFFEDFVFIVPEKDLPTRTLKFTIYDYDRFSRQQVIGYVIYPLSDTESLMSEEINDIWMDVVDDDCKVAFPKGEILFCLQFLPTLGRLTIAILKARNLRLEGEHEELNPYVKISMILGGKSYRKKKTAVCRRTCDPVYNESFVFEIPPEYLERVSFVISVITRAQMLKGTKKLIGRSVVGPYMYSTGEGLEHWQDMLSSARCQLARWHTLI